MNNINQQTSRVVTLLNQEIVLSSLSPMQRAAPQLNYDINKLRTLIAEYVGIELKRVTDEAHFNDDLGLNWLDEIELMILIEDQFAGVEISETQIEAVGDLIQHIESHIDLNPRAL
jgi:acyl carrier protein